MPESFQKLNQLSSTLRVEVGRWLIEEEYRRATDQGEGEDPVVERKDPQEAAGIKHPQDLAHRQSDDRGAAAQENAGNEKAAQDEKQLHPGAPRYDADEEIRRPV